MTYRDKRPVDELSIEELERLLAIKRREARQQGAERMRQAGRVVAVDPAPASRSRSIDVPAAPAALPQPAMHPSAVVRSPAASRTQGAPITAPRFEDGDEDAFVPPALIEDADHGQPDEVYTVEAVPHSTRRRRTLYDRTLLAVEIAAVIGIALIGINLIGAIQTLETETAVAQSVADEQRRAGIPTIAPTPTLRLENFVLPGGHTVQDGLPVFNYAEVPSHLLPLVESQWIQPNISRPQPTTETALAIAIPDLSVDQTIVQGVDWAALQSGVGQMVNGVHPGDPTGNVILAAHNDIYGQIFRHLDQLTAGDQFQIRTQSDSFTYTVTEVRIVEPNDVSVLANRGAATATLISCYPYQVNTQRIIVFADRVS